MKTDKVNLYKKGRHSGYLKGSHLWWFDHKFPHSFSIFDLDAFYPSDYFEGEQLPPSSIPFYIQHVESVLKSLYPNKSNISILEAGSAAGWFTIEFYRRNYDILAVEGTVAGVNGVLQKGVPDSNVIRHDLRLELTLGRHFDIALCTEVAEHLEPPFASMLVRNLTKHSSVIWFSHAKPGRQPHYHHPNEQPEKYWVRLFNFYGFLAYRVPSDWVINTSGRAGLIFTKNQQPELLDIGCSMVEIREAESEGLGSSTPDVPLLSRVRSKVKRFFNA
jgi:hypothetical protein